MPRESRTIVEPMSAPWPCAAASADGSQLLVSVIPNAKRTEAVGLHDGCLRVRLAAPALEGRANDALVEWLAGELRLTRRQVSLRQGASSRRKRLQLDCPLPRLLAWLDPLGLPR
jgi:uncharacterized protein (TIGR00251 family)